MRLLAATIFWFIGHHHSINSSSFIVVACADHISKRVMFPRQRPLEQHDAGRPEHLLAVFAGHGSPTLHLTYLKVLGCEQISSGVAVLVEDRLEQVEGVQGCELSG